MPTVTIQHTFTGTEVAGAPFASAGLNAFTGPFTVRATRTGPVTNSMQIDIKFGDPSNTVCWQFDVAFTAGTSDTGDLGETVGIPSGSWHCTDWTAWSVTYNALQFTPAVPGSTYTFTLTGDFVSSPPPCQYGSSKNEPLASIVEVGPGVLDAIGLTLAEPWAIPAIIAQGLSVVDIETLCSGNPPVDADILPEDWAHPLFFGGPTVALQKIWNKFQISLWGLFCHCNPAPPGGQPPVSPVIVNWTQPTSYITYTETNITETNIAITLNNMLRIIQGNQTTINNITNVLNQVKACACGGAYTLGASHPGLTGSGDLVVDGITGVLVQVTSRPASTRVLEGNPPYLWDLAWITTNDANGMLDEKRVTRDSLVWLPSSAPIATSVAWWTWPDVTLTVTELVPV